MTSLRLALLALSTLAAGTAYAQNAPVAVARATIESVAPDGASLAVRTRSGEERNVRLSDKTTVTLVVPASLADVKPGVFIGAAALPGEGDELKAMEVHIFPEALRGTGEGHRPFDLAPNSTMTNGNVDVRVDGVEGPKLKVTYKGGEQTIVVDQDADRRLRAGSAQRPQAGGGDHCTGHASGRRLDRREAHSGRQGRAGPAAVTPTVLGQVARFAPVVFPV